MKAVLLVLSLFVSTSALANEVELPWTSNPKSVQVSLVKALRALQMDQLGMAEDDLSVKQGETENELVVEDRTGRVSCDVQAGKASCTFSQSDFPWTMSSDSVQATLADALRILQNGSKDSISGKNKGPVSTGPNGEFVIQDEDYKLSCDSTTRGLAQVISSFCKLEPVQ